MKRYLAVIEIDVWAESDIEAACEAVQSLKSLEYPQVHLKPIDDASLEPWVGVDFEAAADGFPYIGEVKPLCFDFID